MNAQSNPSWAGNLSAIMKADPKKAGFLAVLVAVLLVLVGRLLIGSGTTPASAGAAVTAPGAAMVKLETPRRGQVNRNPQGAMAEWLRSPGGAISRNLFTVKFDYFPTDGRSGTNSGLGKGNNDQVTKSQPVQADQQKERQVFVENLQREAGQLRLQSIMMMDNEPKAMIEGRLVGVGDVVASFRVLRIEPRSVILEREGVKLEIRMK